MSSTPDIKLDAQTLPRNVLTHFIYKWERNISSTGNNYYYVHFERWRREEKPTSFTRQFLETYRHIVREREGNISSTGNNYDYVHFKRGDEEKLNKRWPREENPQALPEASVQGGYEGVLAECQLLMSFTLTTSQNNDHWIPSYSDWRQLIKTNMAFGKCHNWIFYIMGSGISGSMIGSLGWGR